jgi:hypothetical protein
VAGRKTATATTEPQTSAALSDLLVVVATEKEYIADPTFIFQISNVPGNE